MVLLKMVLAPPASSPSPRQPRKSDYKYLSTVDSVIDLCYVVHLFVEEGILNLLWTVCLCD